VTFAKDEREDDRWRLREELLLGEVERDTLAKLHEMVHLAEISAAQYVSQNVFDHHYKAANKQYHAFCRLAYPYGTDEASVDERTIEALAELWRAEFGDPDSPEVEATRKYLQSLSGKA
jgi:hypothetical protein